MRHPLRQNLTILFLAIAGLLFGWCQQNTNQQEKENQDWSDTTSYVIQYRDTAERNMVEFRLIAPNGKVICTGKDLVEITQKRRQYADLFKPQPNKPDTLHWVNIRWR